MKRTLLVSWLIAGMAVLASPASADGGQACTRTNPEIAKRLRTDFAERPVAFGLQGDGSLMQVYASKAGETWTVVLTTPGGLSCIVAEGSRWEALPPQPDGPVA